MSTAITTRSRLPLAGIAHHEHRGPARASRQPAFAHLAEQAYAAELAHAERSARVREHDAVFAQGSAR